MVVIPWLYTPVGGVRKVGMVQLFMGDSIEVLSLQLFPASCEDSVNIKTGFQLINQSIKASSFFFKEGTNVYFEF